MSVLEVVAAISFIILTLWSLLSLVARKSVLKSTPRPGKGVDLYHEQEHLRKFPYEDPSRGL